MRKSLRFLLSTAVAGLIASSMSSCSTQLVFADEFNGKAGASVNTSTWTLDNGVGWDSVSGTGWDRNTIQIYTPRSVNQFQDGHGNLIIRARKEAIPYAEPWQGIARSYSSARIRSHFSFDSSGTYVEIRARVPLQPGTWPAFWTFGADGKTWPPEIDGFEFTDPKYGPRGYLHTNLHYGNGTQTGEAQWRYTGAPIVSNAATTFHKYGFYASATQVIWVLDGKAIRTVNFSRNQLWLQRHSIVLSLPLGSFGGSPASNFGHADLVIDYVHAYKVTK